MQVACSKGCGSTVDVPHEDVMARIESDQPLEFAHEPKCPVIEDKIPSYKFEYQVLVVVNRKSLDEPDKNRVRLARSGGTVRADSIQEAMDGLTVRLGAGWNEIEQMQGVMEIDR